jgi:hypothetical protein
VANIQENQRPFPGKLIRANPYEIIVEDIITKRVSNPEIIIEFLKNVPKVNPPNPCQPLI